MGQQKQRLITILFMISGLATMGCSHSGSSNSDQYRFAANGTCYDLTTNTPAPSSSDCSGANTTAYSSSLFSWNGTTCTDIQTDTVVNSAYCTSNVFYMNGSQCWDSLANDAVASNYCSGSSASTPTYSWVNNQCISSTTGQAVVSSYCGKVIDNSVASPCYGIYYTSYNGYWQTLDCYGWNCSGALLYQTANGSPVRCE